ncbi:hypothetical protein C5748_18130 [Phyllobacterium phragmitis]|uniref:Uncharacterized protein n=1 Tax=Phyllobacterium phragmitis TaxID=2670329 RepID=A0A2S9ING0_9HYPH|nr:hypothetical protein [Phyllobacterium phragmitis]PRD42076.1 hypothetical protein C5748_18130 [Phyllobacterium phragmitis]
MSAIQEAPTLRPWHVTVYVLGRGILTIGEHELVGIPSAMEFAPEIRAAAQHLLTFIGEEKFE